MVEPTSSTEARRVSLAAMRWMVSSWRVQPLPSSGVATPLQQTGGTTAAVTHRRGQVQHSVPVAPIQRRAAVGTDRGASLVEGRVETAPVHIRHG